MKRAVAGILWALLITTDVIAGPAVTPEAFAGWLGRDSRMSVEERTKAARFHYIFVSGFLNEWIPGYFTTAWNELRRLGVASDHIHRFAPPSGRSFDYNAQKLKEQILGCVTKDGERVVIVAHSRGAVDALSFALANPSFMRASVEAMFLVQGALKGSYLADYLMGEGKPIDGRMPQPYRALGKYLTRGMKAADRLVHEGLAGLTHSNMQKYWDAKLAKDRDAAAIIGDKIFYIDSSMAPRKMAPVLRIEGTYLQIYYGENDGEVMREDMQLEGIGRRLATLEADHAGLFTPMPISNTTATSRRRFMRALFRAAGQREETN